ncbi:MAG: C4-type zinc ribbon domain-containing protein [Acidimicrobiia bacterium]|nr:C4-type zinc ribbon domain-containing protein [Acidimicrobiia bacterium]
MYLREEERLEGEARALEDREREVDRRMYSGEVSSPRELQAMQADVDQLRRHRRMVEDRELEAMEAREALDREVAGVEAERATVQAELDRLGASLADQEAAIDAELAVELEARDKLASDIAADLLALYERCRERARGVGVARLVGSTCQGCHLSIPATEVDRIRREPPDTVAHCDNCGCILVPA